MGEQEGERQAISKKEKKRQKMKAAKQGDGAEEETEVETPTSRKTMDVGELLFKSTFDNITFEASELFKEISICNNVCESAVPEVLSMTPKMLY